MEESLSPKKRKSSSDKLQDFETVAKRLECDPDLAAFDKKLVKIARAKSSPKAKK
jgi:hypothetical protein